MFISQVIQQYVFRVSCLGIWWQHYSKWLIKICQKGAQFCFLWQYQALIRVIQNSVKCENIWNYVKIFFVKIVNSWMPVTFLQNVSPKMFDWVMITSLITCLRKVYFFKRFKEGKMREWASPRFSTFTSLISFRIDRFFKFFFRFFAWS